MVKSNRNNKSVESTTGSTISVSTDKDNVMSTGMQTAAAIGVRKSAKNPNARSARAVKLSGSSTRSQSSSHPKLRKNKSVINRAK